MENINRKNNKKLNLQALLAPVALVILYVFFSVFGKNFFDVYTLKTILESSYYVGFMAFGVTFVIISGGIDLSLGSNMMCSALIGCYAFSKWGLPLWTGLLLCVAVGTLFGLLNGVMIAKFKLPPFIATLGTQMVTLGLGSIITNVQTQRFPTIGTANEWFKKAFYRCDLLGIKGFPIGAVYLFAAFFIAIFLLSKTKFGRYALAIGSNEEAARLSGVKTDNWKILIYTVCGLFCAIAGIFYAACYTTVIPGTGNGLEMNGITAVIIGGTSMAGGSGSIIGTMIGVFIMSVLKNGLPSIGLQSQWQTFFTGVVVIGAVLLDQARIRAASRVRKN
ncbi:MAG: ABC transporter permease [Eubacteriales bacterium]|nr:ABC transporter permease [Clostridiales bacterium]MDY2769176.1 ABC transporter permease [Eubacteriales bacterium]